MSDSDYDSFLVDKLFPGSEVHLIFGPSGAGVTTFLLQLINDWQSGRPILGQCQYESHPAPFCFVTCNKSITSTRRQMRSLSINPKSIPHLSLVSRDHRPEERNFLSVLNMAMEHVPTMKVLFLDGLAALCEKVSDERTVTQFMLTITEACSRMGITVIATIRSSKARTGEGYVSIRERIIGSGAFCSYSDTKIGIEPTKPSEPMNNSRVITLLPQNSKPEVLNFTLSEFGLLPGEGVSTKARALDEWLVGAERGITVTTSALVELAATTNLSESTVYRWIRIQVELGTLDKVGHGQYRIPTVS